jgi:hypothetical protein
MSTSKSWKIQASLDTIARLEKMAADLGGSMTANGIAAMIVFEVAKIPACELWQALGVMRQLGEKPSASAVDLKRVPAGRPELLR